MKIRTGVVVVMAATLGVVSLAGVLPAAAGAQTRFLQFLVFMQIGSRELSGGPRPADKAFLEIL